MLAVAATLYRRLLLAGIALALAVTNLAVVTPVWEENEPPEAGPAVLTLLVANLDARNDDYGAVAELVRARRPDVFAAVELTPAWAAGLEGALRPYRFRLIEMREGPYGLGIFSRQPLSEAEATFPAGPDYPLLLATVAARSEPARLALLHPRVPATPTDAARHETLLGAAAAAARGAEGSAVVLGDLNTTPWSARYRELLEDGGLEDTRAGLGLQTSWPSFLPTILRIPIDHVLVTPDLAATERRVGPEISSDHLPVWVELAQANRE